MLGFLKLRTGMIHLPFSRRRICLSLLACIAAAGPSYPERPPASQFNLRCSFASESRLKGTAEEAALHLMPAPIEDLVYRIDAERHLACFGACEAALSIEVAPDGAFLLSSSQTGTNADVTFARAEMLRSDRQTLVVQQAAKTATGTTVGTQQVFRCQTSEFGGLPE